MSVYVVALTGGIAAGKSTVQRRFESHGVRVYDADEAARAVVVPGSPALDEIARAFGSDVLSADGRLDRAAMRRRVFTDAAARTVLERILHPRIRDWLRESVDADPGPYCIVSIPLLAENHTHYTWVDRILVVDASGAVQMERLMRRDGVDEMLASSMIAAQASRETRLAIADDVITNEGSETAIDEQVAELDNRYRERATAH